MEDDFKKNGGRTQKNIIEDDLKKNKNRRRPQKNEMEDDVQKKNG